MPDRNFNIMFRKSRKGFSILELLIAVIIIGVLAAILIPIIGNRANQARVSSAKADLDRIGAAMERQAIDTGYYVRLWALDDIAGSVVSIPATNPSGTVFNSVRQWDDPAFYFESVDTNFFIYSEGDVVGDFVPSNVNSNLLDQIQRSETDFNWNGPYISFNSDENSYPSWGATLAKDGLPDDPWGNNYLLFTREGLVLEPDGDIVTTADFPIVANNPTATPAVIGADCNVFDRTLVLSLGPDGVPGDGGTQLGEGDDLIRFIGP